MFCLYVDALIIGNTFRTLLCILNEIKLEKE